MSPVKSPGGVMKTTKHRIPVPIITKNHENTGASSIEEKMTEGKVLFFDLNSNMKSPTIAPIP